MSFGVIAASYGEAANPPVEVTSELTQQNSGTWTGTTLTVTLPQAPATTSTLVLIVAGNTTVNTPLGWTSREAQVVNMGHYLYTITDTTSNSWSLTCGASGNGTWWVGEVTHSAYDVSAGANDPDGATTYATPALTPTAGERMLIASVASLSVTSTVRTVSGWTDGFTEITDLCSATSDHPMQGVAVRSVTASGTSYSTGATYSANSIGRSALICSLTVGVTPESPGEILDSPLIAWEGGPDYWQQFPRAAAAGWISTSFFPISVFLGKASPSHVASLKDAGINLYMAVEHSPSTDPLSNITSQGMFAMPGIDEWTQAEVGNDPGAVAWFISDEFDMGMGVNEEEYGPGEYGWLAEQQARVNQARSYNDGRFIHANFGNGILRTFWSTNTMDQHVALMDSASADKYTYTSPDVAGIIDGWHDAPDWPNGVPVARAYSYGWQADQMRRFQNQASLRPIWTFVETAMPFLTENGARAIEPDEIEGAVWSALIHEARGIAYFQHNNDGRGTYSIVNIPAVHAKVKAINTKVQSLAPVLNTQSRYNTSATVNGFTYHRFTFHNDTDAMVKVYGGDVYIFAGLGMGHATGSKTFTVPAGVDGTVVEVVGESRTIPVVGGAFTDIFAQEYTHHVYKIALS